VVARTIEAGLRGHTRRLSWSAGLFRAQNSHDILFVTSEQTGFGYFSNFNRTRRQGIELNVSHRQSRVTFGGGYTLLSATFQSEESLNGTGNSSNDEGPGLEGNIDVRPGDRLPLMPRHVLKVYADIQATRALSLDVDVIASSGVLARGNENGQHQPDGVYYLGPGHTDAYAVVNLGLRYQLRRSIQLFGQVDNVLNTHYTTAAQLGETGFTAQGTFLARPFPATQGEFPLQQSTFFAPGAPTTAWGGIRVTF
jgi:outer membrane receptor protein involved in Fe transport